MADTKDVCTHITANNYEDAGDYYEALVELLGQIKALFVGLEFIAEHPTACEGDMLHLSHLGEDLAEEAIRRAEAFRAAA